MFEEFGHFSKFQFNLISGVATDSALLAYDLNLLLLGSTP